VLSNIERMTLKNKMVVLLKPDSSSPLATINLRIKSGFLNEPDELTGISHLLEHMLFKSTKKMETAQLKEKFRHLGGVFNGETMYDYTMYYCTVPKNNLRAALELEADLVYNSLFDRGELEKEKQVVIQEIRRKDDMLSIFAWEKMMENSFVRHPFRRWRIGTTENITEMKREDILRFHNENYSPRNTILTITGDFESDKVSHWVREYFEKLRPLPPKKLSFPIEPEQTSLRYQSLKGDLKQTYLKIGFHAPGVLEEDNFALVILSYILGQGKSSRLSQILKARQGLVNSISSDLYNLKDLGVYFFEVELEDKNILPVLIEVFRQIEKIKQSKLSKAELARAKNLWRADFLSNFESLAGQADILSLFEQYGDYRLIQKLMHKIEQVSKKDIQKAAKRYLNLDKATVLRYAPQKDKTALESLRRKIILGIKAKGPEFKPVKSISFKKIGSAQKEGKSLNTELLNYGTYLLTREKHTLPMVTVDFYFKGGRNDENEGNCGITRLCLENVLKTKSKGESLTSQLEVLGGTLSTTAEPDFFGYSMEISAENLDGALGIVFEILQHPTFEKKIADIERKLLIAEIEKSQDDMLNYPVHLLKRTIFPGHPYAKSLWGDERSLEKITLKQLENWHKTYYIRQNLVISAVGDFKTEWLKKKIELGLKSLGRVKIEEQKMILVHQTKERTNIVPRSKNQTAIACGFLTCGFADDDLYPLKLIQGIFSGMGGRLFTELREKRGMAYAVYAACDAYKNGGIFYGYIGTSPQKEKIVIDLLKQEFEKIGKRKVEADELEKSKAYISGAYNISLQTNSALAHQYAKNHILGRDAHQAEEFGQRIDKITSREILHIARKYFDLNNFYLGMIRGRK